MKARRKWQRLDCALNMIGPDAAQRALALRMAQSAVLADVAAGLEEGVYRLTPAACRVFYCERLDGQRVRVV